MRNTKLPIYSPAMTEHDEYVDEIRQIKDVINIAAVAIVLGSPDYRDSIPDVMKIFLDHS